MNVLKYLELAAKVSRLKDDDRTYYHGAVGIRRDGVLVAAANGNPRKPEPKHHCEYRLLRKLGKGGTVFLVRTNAAGLWADTTPCTHCQNALRARKVSRCYYSTGPEQWLCWRATGKNSSPFPPGPRLAGMMLDLKPADLSAWLPEHSGAPGSLFGINREPVIRPADQHIPAQVAQTEPGPSVSPVPRGLHACRTGMCWSGYTCTACKS